LFSSFPNNWYLRLQWISSWRTLILSFWLLFFSSSNEEIVQLFLYSSFYSHFFLLKQWLCCILPTYYNEKSIYICPILRPEVYPVCQCVSVRCDNVTQGEMERPFDLRDIEFFSRDRDFTGYVRCLLFVAPRKSRKVFRHRYGWENFSISFS